MQENPKTCPDLAGLEQYIRRGAAVVPPYYAGRNDVLADIETMAANSWIWSKEVTSPTPKMTRILQGAPGAGKSTTLLYLKQEWEKTGYITQGETKNKVSAPRMLYMGTSSTASDPERLLRVLAFVINPVWAKELHPGYMQEETSTRGIQYGITIQNSQKTIHQPTILTTYDDLAALFPPNRWTAPVVVAIDEFQNFPGEAQSHQGLLLQDMHSNSANLPLTLVLAGLGDTQQRASGLGLTRIAQNAKHSLDCLDANAQSNLVEGWCNHFLLPEGNYRNQLKVLIEHTEGWPHHMYCTMSAFASEVVASGGDVNPVDYTKVDNRAVDLRQGYYNDRMSGAMAGSDLLVAAIMQQLCGTESIGEVVEVIENHAGAGYGPRWRLPDDMNTLQFFYHLVHQGALQVTAGGLVQCPIPSFREYLITPFMALEPNNATSIWV